MACIVAIEILVTLSFIVRPEMRFHGVNRKPSGDTVGTFNSTYGKMCPLACARMCNACENSQILLSGTAGL